MSIIVQKYGGSSVATPAHIRRVARRVVETRQRGHDVVVVVSAMGNTTNDLLDLAGSVSDNPHRRELDMLVTVGERISMALLSMAIHDLGHPAVSFTGSQSGIITTDAHTHARIVKVKPDRVRQALSTGQIVIVAGFQGVSERLEITSLGRGGTDATAVAMAAALGAECAEICSDVDGVYSADPRVVPEARKLDEIGYAEMQTLADAGAKVLHAEAVEWARREGIDVHCVATDDPHRAGTRVGPTPEAPDQRVVAVTHHKAMFHLEPEVAGQPAPHGLPALLAAHGASGSELWMLPMGWAAAVPQQNVHGVEAFEEALDRLGGIRVRRDLTWITVVGRKLTAPPGLGQRAVRCLELKQVPIRGTLVDPGRLRFLVDQAHATTAVQALHRTLIEG
ncbi:MAG: aspartate kinase [Bradymonadia bacterium]